MTKPKNLLAAAMAATLLLISAGCSSPGVVVPDVLGTEEEIASSAVSALGLVPNVVESPSDLTEKGRVMRTTPASGTEVAPGTKIEIVVSSGPSRIEAEAATLEWKNVSYRQDEWEFFAPVIEDGSLKIEIDRAKLMADVEWIDPYNRGEGFGTASINDVFDKSVPIRLLFGKQVNKSGVDQELNLIIPTSDLDVQKPTTIYLKLFALVNGIESEIPLTFTMTW